MKNHWRRRRVRRPRRSIETRCRYPRVCVRLGKHGRRKLRRCLDVCPRWIWRRWVFLFPMTIRSVLTKRKSRRRGTSRKRRRRRLDGVLVVQRRRRPFRRDAHRRRRAFVSKIERPYTTWRLIRVVRLSPELERGVFLRVGLVVAASRSIRLGKRQAIVVSRVVGRVVVQGRLWSCLLYTSPSPRDVEETRMPSSA